MKGRQFFIRHAWLGKLVGALLGYLISGAVGAIFGILLGNFLDKQFLAYLTRPHWYYHVEKRKAVQKLFFETTFSVMGYIAKANGRVTPQAIRLAEDLMLEMGLNHPQRLAAQHCFNEGKKTNFDLEQKIALLKQASFDNPELLKLFVEIQYQAAKLEGLSLQKQRAINTILQYMDFAPLHQQYRFYEDFVNDSANQQQREQASSSRQRETYENPPNRLEHAYGILEILPTDNKAEVKRAYRKLMSKNHPDKLIAKGLPEEMIKMANEKTQKIRKAYELICTSKGW